MSSKKETIFDDFLRRLCEHAKVKVGIASAASVLGMTRQSLQNYKTRGRLPENQVYRYSFETGVSPKWLLRGEGSKFTTKIYGASVPERELEAAEITIPWEELECEKVVKKESPEHFTTINVYSLDLIREPDDKGHRVPIQTLLMAPTSMAEAAPIGFKVTGEAMAPSINDGAIIGVQHNDTVAIDGDIYLLRTAQGDVFIRRVYLGAGTLKLKAENPRFPELEVGSGSIQIMGKVAWVIQYL